ncbi:RNA polymerase sigma-70 factor [Mangrovibacterium diazotrophicum]|uniref:RNA polymerase sigma-70 factor (ECF subfamily) n=1 Tax=Mangrovibacterium diazotrophicum TaxID=1261403 RepID=A0A419WA54_9BACT|nr:RNA polymerase sigma-70 factor [Mangrovibacterium diazotrophicum]RKD92361.1 RNA polymerase sigma-70 factor (ECF subfamily) [Mangrovibacterium diazotrophicum]
MRIEDRILFNEIKQRNRKVFEALFYEYYPGLVRFAENFVFNPAICEDIVQTLFLYFWENAAQMNINLSLKAYFYQAVRNRCLNHLRDLQVEDKHKLLYIEASLDCDDPDFFEEVDLSHEVEQAIASLPDQMKELFLLKYRDGLRTREIAELKEVSENTVKTQLLRAKERLRKKLLDNTSLLFFF